MLVLQNRFDPLISICYAAACHDEVILIGDDVAGWLAGIAQEDGRA